MAALPWIRDDFSALTTKYKDRFLLAFGIQLNVCYPVVHPISAMPEKNHGSLMRTVNGYI
jgi:hypothetical protein